MASEDSQSPVKRVPLDLNDCDWPEEPCEDSRTCWPDHWPVPPIPIEEMEPEAVAYWRAMRFAEDARSGMQERNLEGLLEDPMGLDTFQWVQALNSLPWEDRVPVTFGCLLKCAAAGCDPMDSPGGPLLGLGVMKRRPYADRHKMHSETPSRVFPELPPDHSLLEYQILHSVQRGFVKLPEFQALSLEVFPRRIWQRCLRASPKVDRLIQAGLRSMEAARGLMRYRRDPAGQGRPFGDFHDLIALGPRSQHGLKDQIVNRMMARVEEGIWGLDRFQVDWLPQWLLLNHPDDHGLRADRITEELERLALMGEDDLLDRRTRSHIRELGMLLFRLGRRADSRFCARLLGTTLAKEGWQCQPTIPLTTGWIHRITKSWRTGPRDWMKIPAVAASPMTLPHWLDDGVGRIDELMRIFEKAQDFPWAFDRLYHVFQWHLALAGNEAALAQVGELDQEGFTGLEA